MLGASSGSGYLWNVWTAKGSLDLNLYLDTLASHSMPYNVQDFIKVEFQERE